VAEADQGQVDAAMTWVGAEAEARAAELLRSWLAPEQVRQLDAHGAFAVEVGVHVLVLVPGSNMVYWPANQMAYGWFPGAVVPPSDALLCQALALTDVAGLREMAYYACKWPRGCAAADIHRTSGYAWRAVDAVARDIRLTLW
jgi:hypothetical protein